jgi:ferritin-like metal-binding protein YciE
VKKLSSPKDLLVAQLSELLWVERRLAFDVLPDVIEKVHDDQLRALFQEHHEQTQEHVKRVERAFRELGMEPSSAFSPGFSGLVEQHETVTKKIVEPALEDRWHASAGVAVEHFELALYSCIDGVEGLDPNEEDETAALKKLERWLAR